MSHTHPKILKKQIKNHIKPQEKHMTRTEMDAYRVAYHEWCTKKQATCKNATFRLEVVDKAFVVVPGEGCQNSRRQGSAYCQDCSDKHHV